jgi:hypothetical protein
MEGAAFISNVLPVATVHTLLLRSIQPDFTSVFTPTSLPLSVSFRHINKGALSGTIVLTIRYGTGPLRVSETSMMLSYRSNSNGNIFKVRDTA